jgi:hypothetical protein
MKTLLCAILLLAMPVPAQVPQWAQTHTHRDYPVDFFLIGVGSGKGDHAAEIAKRSAQTDVASQVRVNLQSQIDRVQKTYTLNNNEQSSEEFKQKSRIVVEEEISSVRIAETAIDMKDGTVYALAVLDREDFQRTMGAALDRAWKNVTEARQGAQNFLQNGRLNDALQNLIVARQLAAGIFPKMAQHDAVGKVMYHSDEIISPTELTSQMRDVLSRVRLERKSGNGQKVKIGQKFPEPLVVSVSVKSNGNHVPVVGIPVDFSSIDGMKLGTQITGSDGTAGFTLTARMVKKSVIRATMNPTVLAGEFDESLSADAIEFVFTALPASSTIAIAAVTVTPAASKKLEATFSALAAQLGYQTEKKSRYILEITVDAAVPTAIATMSGTLYSAMPDVFIVLKDKETGMELAALKTKGKGVGRSASEANEKAAAEFRIGDQDLAALLEKLPD